MSEPGDGEELTPRQPRQNVLLGAEISGFGGGTPTKHRVRDLSASGARVDRAGSLKVGSTVLVSVGVLEQVGATVIWVRDDLAGLKFAEAIDPDAARSKALVSPTQKTVGKHDIGQTDATPRNAPGWIGGLNSPYRK
ncbi:PilZ domain-containing protein [Sphingomonas sp. G-3-2-10]|uniref:PilZ domain-containing protein n=1 Tax=Sphingomonas sp. G-3-2-10 TaxID=2728838 RepID=UPI00146A9FB1|nr:PilZ domain-containing protein [Sphingomonas sp. G-3-2-10]NML04492.1 PilZ domain-containing protein [Sphingomonas sp. G-3-2-10]